MKLSIVATLYQSAGYLEAFHARACAAAQALVGDDYEIVLVNDGSLDESLAVAVQLARQDDHVLVVELSRNFGHHKAMMTGLAYASGERVFLIDSDLEEEPEWLSAFAKQMQQESCDVVFGVQTRRKGGWFERWSGRWFYVLFNLLTGLAIPEDQTTARLMTRRYVEALLAHEERELFLLGIWHITGFRQHPQSVVKHSSSPTTYTLRRKLSLLVNAVTSFSNAPLKGIFYIGVGISLLAIAYIAYVMVHWLFMANAPSGWTSLIASVWLLGGMIIAFIGVVGIYLSRVFSETKQRPYAIVRQTYGHSSEDGMS